MAKNISKLQILAELERRRAEVRKNTEAPTFVIEQYCFDKQIAFIRDTHKFKTAVCSRRSGKTISCAADLIDTALHFAKINVLYITLNRLAAKRIIWKELLDINKTFNLNGRVNESELTISFANGSQIYVSGAKDKSEIEKFRGMALKKVYIDEAQSFRGYIRELIDDVLVPALFDYDGSLILIGTPGPVCAGPFYEASTSGKWSNHKWNILDNPHIELKSGKTVNEILRSERDRRGITENDATYRRESLGEWVEDSDALVFKYNPHFNDYDKLPVDKYDYIFGVDIGYEDSDAIAVLAFSQVTGKVFLVEEFVKSKQTISDLVAEIKRLQARYEPIKMVMDAGALGKKIQEEIRHRHSLNLEAATKERKLEFIKLMNDDLRSGRLMAKSTSAFAEDSKLVQWNYDNPVNPKIDSSYHSDITDAVLYAWRECKHYIDALIEPTYAKNSNEYMDKMERDEAAKIQSRHDDPEMSDAMEQYEQDLEEIEDIW